MSKGKILLISHLFSPNNAIGAVRPTKIAKRLIADGYEVDVFTYGYTDNDSLESELEVTNKYVINNKKIEFKKDSGGAASPQQTSGFVYMLKRHYVTYLSQKRGKVFLNAFKKAYDETLCKNNYDAVFTTFGPLCCIEAGFYVKKKNPEIKWICDFRDPILVSVTPTLYRPYFKYIQDKACKKADVIVAVSNGYVQRICGDKYKEKTHMIPNGYEKTDLENIDAPPFSDGKLHITYVGALYSGKRDLSPIFKAAKELIDENSVDGEKIVFHYAGTDFSVFEAQAKNHGIQNTTENHGRLPRKECLELQYSSHILVLSTWNDKGEEGVFPGKFLEYMLMSKPIIAVVDGSLANSEVKLVMNETNLGVTYEAATANEDFALLKAYIKKQYDNVINNGETEFLPQKAVLDRYNYDNIIERIKDLIK